jgi:dihydrofolate reductase
MGRLIVIEFVTLDGIVEDPDGSGGTTGGGWAFRHGPEAVAGDKFGLGAVLDSAALLLGRVTWQLFAGIFPARTDPFSARMNAVPKLVVSRSPSRADDWISSWANSTVLQGDLVEEVGKRREEQDVIVAGSVSVVRRLIEHDLVDQYRLLVFPSALGRGRRLFDGRAEPLDLRLVATEEIAGRAVRLVYDRRPAA